jgi:hypothetical protein
VQLQVFEGEPKEQARRFGRVAEAVVVWMEDEADLALAMLVVDPLKYAVADQLVCRLEGRGEREDVAWCVDRAGLHLLLEDIADFVLGPRVPVEVRR